MITGNPDPGKKVLGGARKSQGKGTLGGGGGCKHLNNHPRFRGQLAPHFKEVPLLLPSLVVVEEEEEEEEEKGEKKGGF